MEKLKKLRTLYESSSNIATDYFLITIALIMLYFSDNPLTLSMLVLVGLSTIKGKISIGIKGKLENVFDFKPSNMKKISLILCMSLIFLPYLVLLITEVNFYLLFILTLWVSAKMVSVVSFTYLKLETSERNITKKDIPSVKKSNIYKLSKMFGNIFDTLYRSFPIAYLLLYFIPYLIMDFKVYGFENYINPPIDKVSTILLIKSLAIICVINIVYKLKTNYFIIISNLLAVILYSIYAFSFKENANELVNTWIVITLFICLFSALSSVCDIFKIESKKEKKKLKSINERPTDK